MSSQTTIASIVKMTGFFFSDRSPRSHMVHESKETLFRETREEQNRHSVWVFVTVKG